MRQVSPPPARERNNKIWWVTGITGCHIQKWILCGDQGHYSLYGLYLVCGATWKGCTTYVSRMTRRVRMEGTTWQTLRRASS